MRVTVVRALPGIGDWLCAVPALAHLKHLDPSARVNLIGLKSTAALVERYPELVDEFVAFPGFPGVPEASVAPARLQQLLTERYGLDDVCLQMHGSGVVTNEFCLMLGARQTVLTSTAVSETLICPGMSLVPYAELHETDRLMAVVCEAMSARPTRAELPWFPTTLADRDRARQVLARVAAPRRYAVLHPGASRDDSRWPAEKFAEVASELVDRGLWVVLTGSQAEQDLAEQVCRAAGPGVCSVAGRLDLGGTAAVIENADLVVSNDTGIAHLSAAVGTPLVVVYVATDPKRWAPRGPAAIEQVVRTSLLSDADDAFPAAPLVEPSVADVLGAVDRLGTQPVVPRDASALAVRLELPLERVASAAASAALAVGSGA